MAHVVVHRIFSLSVSLPVRGADGLAKRAPYGGVERQRLSSQSVKAHLRSATGIPGSMSDLAVELEDRYVGKKRTHWPEAYCTGA
jgi:hypothetical protein